MEFSILRFIAPLAAVASLIFQWIGVVMLGKSSRSRAWWLLVAGTLFTTIALLLIYLAPLIVPRSYTSGDFPLMIVGWTTSIAGNLLFIGGFALHALSLSRGTDRNKELEEVAAAMSEELQRLRERGAGTRSDG